MPKPKRTSSHPKARKPKPKDTADGAHSGAYYDTMRIVLELGDDLGFLPAPQRLSLARHLQDRGAVVDTVVSDETAFVVSRPMSAEEFDASAALQNAVRHGVPIVGLRYVLRCDEARRALPVADALLPLPEDSRELLGIVSDLRGREALAVAPEVAIAAFANRVPRALYDAAVPVAEAGTPEAVAARTSGVMMEPYSETRAAEQYASDCGVKGAAPPGRDAPPPFPPHRAASTGHGHYAVLRESYDGRVKVELHVAVGPAPCCLLPFRVMRYVGSSGVSGAPVATLQEAEEIYAGLCTGGTAMPPATVGSLEAKQRALFDVSGAALPSVPSAVEGFVQQAFTTAAAFLADRTSLSSQASASGAVVGGVGLGELRKAQAAVVALAELFLAEAKREGNTTGVIVLTDKAALAKAAELTKAYTKVVRAKKAPEVVTTSDELAEAEDTVRLLVAMTAVGESSHRNVFAAPLPAQYASLQCLIAHVSGTLENTAAHAALQAWPTGLRRAVKAVYSVRRVDEHIAFQGSVGNTRLLYHGTHAGSLVPILRGGLEVPASARLRRDRGMLGRGIYFAESPTVAARYCGSSGGKLYILVAEVALGTAYDTTQHEYDLARPPLGFDSVHGAPTPGGAFKDHEYVVYAEAQQRLQFVVEIDASALTAADVTSKGPVVAATAAIGAEQDALVPVERVTPLKEQKITVKAPVVGLQAKDETPVPLRRTDIKAQVVDTIAEVTLLQEYFNAGSAPVEAKYVFPLQGGAAVCGFEAFINHKHVVGTVKEKEQARKEYKAAVAAGHGAYLMDESEETPDVFTISVGNLPPKTRVVVKVTYVIELGIDAARNAIEFVIPSHVHPAKAQKELATKTQGSTGTIAAAGAGAVTLELGLDMPFDITAVECSHPVQRKRTACRATVRSDNLAMDGKDFVCAVRLGVMNTPRIWVEEDAAGSKAAMITFFPALDEERAAAEATARSKEVLLLLDASASMAQGDAAKDAKVAALHALATLPDTAVVNAAMFGGRTVHALPKAEPLADCRPRLEAWIQAEYGAVLGVTDIAPVLLGLSAACRDGPNATTELPGHARPRREVDVLLFSDGLLCDEPRVLAVLRAAPSLRVFTVAVGSAACAPSMYAAARAGRGQLAVLRGGAKSRWAAAVERQTARTAQPALTDIAVEWSTEHSARLRRKTNAAVTQSPASVPCVFSGESTVVYGVFPHQARQCELVARHTGAGAERDQYGDWPEERFLVTATGTSFRTGALVHRLAAKARIRDWTDGSLLDLAAAADDAVASTTEATAVGAVHNEAQKAATKQAIIGLGCRYGLVTPFTSMVAVEERTDEERAEQGRGKGEAACTTPAVAALSAHVAVDPIPEVSYLEEHLPWDRLPPLPKAQAPAAAPALVPVTAWRPPKAGVPLPTAALPPPRRDTYAVVSHADLRRQAELLGAAAAAQAAPADPGWDRMAAAAREAHERHRTRLAPPDLALPERRPLPMPSMEVDLRPHEATSAGVDPTAGGLLMHDDDFRYAMAHAVSEEFVIDQPMDRAGGRAGRRGKVEGRVPESNRRRRRDRGLGAMVEASESEEEDVYGMDLFGSNVITPAVAAGDRRLMDTRADTRECWAAPEPMLEEATLSYSRAAMQPQMMMAEEKCAVMEDAWDMEACKKEAEKDDFMVELCDEELELDCCMAECAEVGEFDDDEDEDDEPMATMGGAMNYRQSSKKKEVCLDSDSSSDDSYDEDFCSSVDEAPAARGRGGRGGFLGLVGSRGRGGPPMGGEGRGRGRGGPPPAPPRPEASGYGGPPLESFKKSSGKLFASNAAFGAAPAAAAPSAPPPPPPPAPAGFAASSAPRAPPPPPGAPVPMAAAAAAPCSLSVLTGAPMPSAAAPMAFGAAPPPPPTASFAQQPSPQQQQQQQQPQARGFGAPAGGFGAPPGKGGASFGQGGGGPSKPMSSVGFGAAPKARPDTAMRSRAAPTSMSDRDVTRTEACDDRERSLSDRMQSLQSSLSRRRSSTVERERGVTIDLQRRSAEVEECQRVSSSVEQALMQQREQLEALSCRSEELQASAQMFRHKSKKKEKRMKERHFDKCDAAGESPSPTAPAPVAVGPADPLVSVPGRTYTPPLPFEASPLPPPAPVIKPVPGRNGVEIAVFAAAAEPLLTIPAAACLPTTARATVRLSEAAEVRVVERVLDTSSPLYAQTAGPGLLRVAVHVAGDRSVTVTAEVDGTHAPASVVIKDRVGRGDVAAVVDRDAALWAVVMGHQASAVVTGLPAHASEQWLREVMPSLTSCAVARCPATGLATGTAALGWASISSAVASLKSAVAAAPQWQWRLFNSGEDIASALCAWTPLRGETLEAVLHAAGVQAGPAANRVLTAVFGTTDVSSSQASVLRAAVNEVGQRCGAHIAAREPLPVARLDAVQRALCEESSLGLGTLLYPYPVRCVPSVAWPDRGVPCATQPEDRYCYGAEVGYRTVDEVYAPALATVC